MFVNDKATKFTDSQLCIFGFELLNYGAVLAKGKRFEAHQKYTKPFSEPKDPKTHITFN